MRLVQRFSHADRKIESLAPMDVYGRVAGAAEFSVTTATAMPATRCRGQIPLKWSALARNGQPRMKDIEERGFIKRSGRLTLAAAC
jgi:hypothetical protein